MPCMSTVVLWHAPSKSVNYADFSTRLCSCHLQCPSIFTALVGFMAYMYQRLFGIPYRQCTNEATCWPLVECLCLLYWPLLPVVYTSLLSTGLLTNACTGLERACSTSSAAFHFHWASSTVKSFASQTQAASFMNCWLAAWAVGGLAWPRLAYSP